MRFRNLWLAAVVSAFSLPAAVGAQSTADSVHQPATSERQNPPAANASGGGSSFDADMFNRMDTDEDGFISRDEAKGTSLENRFELLDLDHDGQLSPSEVDAGSAAQEN
jgi:EF hand domain-containing protein